MAHPTNKLERKKIGIKKAKKMEKELIRQGSYFNSFSDLTKGIWRKTRNFCSNPFCCGNPRRQKGTESLTLQERLILHDIEYWEEHYGDLEAYKD